MKGAKADEDGEEWVTLDDVLRAIPRYKARFIVLKITVFNLGWLTSSANVFLVMNSIFHSQLPDNFEGHKIPYIVVLLFLSLAEVVGFFHGLLLVYGSDTSNPKFIRDSMILAMITTVSNWMALFTILLSYLPIEMANQPLIMTAFTFAGLFVSNSYYFVLNEF
nr:uncharacterized protein LOC106678909 [Halyomorpha halys]